MLRLRNWSTTAALSLLRTEQYDAAIADFDEAIHIDPDHVDVLNNRGRAYWLKGDLDMALADLDAALRIAPDDVNILISHGAVLADKGDHDGAIADFDKVLASQADNATP